MSRVTRVCLLLLLVLSAAAYTAAQTRPYTPRPGSAERAAIMDALRDPVQLELHQRVVFMVEHLKVQQGWAFMSARPQRPDGSPIEWAMTDYWDAYRAGMLDDNVCALLYKQRGRWRVATYVIGATDVPYGDWPAIYGAPRAIFW